MKKIYDYFKNAYDNKMLAQSFLIGNTTYENIKDELLLILKDFFFDEKSKIEDNPDLYIIKPENNLISKDKIKTLLKDISTTSQFNSNKVYIIDKCELLNEFSYNAILKTLEEPQPGIYAILITSNIESIKETISSRCQKIFISSEVGYNNFDENIVRTGDLFIENIEKNKIKMIGLNYDIYAKISDRAVLKNVLSYILGEYYKSLYNIVENKDDNSLITMNNDIMKISKKILVINNNILNLDYYLNKNLSIDRFIIEMWRCDL